MDKSNIGQGQVYWVPKEGEEISKDDTNGVISFEGWKEERLRKVKIHRIFGIMYIAPGIGRLGVPIRDAIIRLTSSGPDYRGGRVIIAEFEYEGKSRRCSGFSGDIEFMEGGKEALEQLEKEIQELDKANLDAAPSFAARFARAAIPMAVLAAILPYRK